MLLFTASTFEDTPDIVSVISFIFSLTPSASVKTTTVWLSSSFVIPPDAHKIHLIDEIEEELGVYVTVFSSFTDVYFVLYFKPSVDSEIKNRPR